MKKIKFTPLLGLTLFLTTTLVSAQSVPTSQQASGLESLRESQDTSLQLRQQIEAPIGDADEGDDITASFRRLEAPDSEPIPVTEIIVEGIRDFDESKINEIIDPYKGQVLTLPQMQDIADRITDVYRSNGYITTRAVLPPQKIVDGILKIQIIEGTLGTLDIRGNKYFSERNIKRRITLKKGEIFNYNELRNNLEALNQYQDRTVQSVLVPGQEQGTTDVVLNVEDQLPIHIGFSMDNFGSRYLDKNRFQTTLTHNNLLGFDDILTLRWQTGEENFYRLSSLRYLFPLTNKTQIGLFAAKTQMKLGKEFTALNARGKSEVLSLFVTHKLVNEPTMVVELTGAFDYKDIYNFQLNVESSRDRVRVASTGLNVDFEDAWGGRVIFNNRLDVGIPDILGGLDSIDNRSSRKNFRAGGEFYKLVTDLLRLQSMPWNSTLLVKTQFQFANRALVGAEQAQIGGIQNVRAYPTGELSGDEAQTATLEWSFPVYGVPKSWKIPFTQDSRIYDSVRMAAFYDYGRASVNSQLLGEAKDESLSGYGLGIRINLPSEFFARIDVAWPADETPSDGKHMHTLFQVTKDF